jgi:hypothetical protein
LRWTCKSLRHLAEALQQQGHQVSRTLVAELLNAARYSLQGNRKTKEGDSHPDRDDQFVHINTQLAAALAEQQPVISVDTKTKELVGNFRNKVGVRCGDLGTGLRCWARQRSRRQYSGFGDWRHRCADGYNWRADCERQHMPLAALRRMNAASPIAHLSSIPQGAPVGPSAGQPRSARTSLAMTSFRNATVPEVLAFSLLAG